MSDATLGEEENVLRRPPRSKTSSFITPKVG